MAGRRGAVVHLPRYAALQGLGGRDLADRLHMQIARSPAETTALPLRAEAVDAVGREVRQEGQADSEINDEVLRCLVVSRRPRPAIFLCFFSRCCAAARRPVAVHAVPLPIAPLPICGPRRAGPAAAAVHISPSRGAICLVATYAAPKTLQKKGNCPPYNTAGLCWEGGERGHPDDEIVLPFCVS